jgi:hypothetical protein
MTINIMTSGNQRLIWGHPGTGSWGRIILRPHTEEAAPNLDDLKKIVSTTGFDAINRGSNPSAFKMGSKLDAEWDTFCIFTRRKFLFLLYIMTDFTRVTRAKLSHLTH